MAPRQRISPPSSSLEQESREPLVPKLQAVDEESEKARQHHDYFNLFALVFVIGTTLIDWDFVKLLKGYGPAESFKGDFFLINWLTCQVYFAVDLIWVSFVPTCVKSPGTIIKHHLVVIAYLFGPVIWPEYRWFMGACLSVEINTWFLIMRRVVYKRQLPTFCIDLVGACFYTSWIIIRCVIFPAILYTFLSMAYEAILETGIWFHWPMVFIPVHFALCVMNLKWSYDLFEPIIRRWMQNDAPAVTVATGL